jgi:phosphatidylserine/phosphatidylglycerophosphate/cardiolipin synthase-like enzyme
MKPHKETSMKKYFLFLAFFVSLPAWPHVEVVVTNPVETDLAVPGVRDTKTVWIQMLCGAKHSIDVEQFYISDQAGEALVPVLDCIRESASRGVKVRLLVDKKFFATYPETVKELGQRPNIESRVVDYDSLTGGVQHSKFFVVDGNASFIGSANFDWRALSHIHEVGFKVDGVKFSLELLQIFNADWKAANGTGDVETASDSLFGLGLVASPPKMTPSFIPFSLDKIVSEIKAAERSIKIQIYEFSTGVYGNPTEKWHVLEDALKAAAARGVKIQLLVDATNMKKAKAELLALGKLANFEVRSVTIPKFSGGEIPFARLIHSKYMIVDDARYWMGTDNWSKNYFFNSRGVGVMGDTPRVSETLMQIFQRLWHSAYASDVRT